MPRPLVLVALVWVPFLSIFGFAAMGDRSHPHLAFHLVALALLVPATVLAWRIRSIARTRAQRVLGGVLSVTVPVAVVGHLLELAVALDRFAADGWVDRDTADLWVSGPHQWAANVTIPAMLLSMVVSLALVLSLISRRGRSERATADAHRP